MKAGGSSATVQIKKWWQSNPPEVPHERKDGRGWPPSLCPQSPRIFHAALTSEGADPKWGMRAEDARQGEGAGRGGAWSQAAVLGWLSVQAPWSPTSALQVGSWALPSGGGLRASHPLTCWAQPRRWVLLSALGCAWPAWTPILPHTVAVSWRQAEAGGSGRSGSSPGSVAHQPGTRERVPCVFKHGDERW